MVYVSLREFISYRPGVWTGMEGIMIVMKNRKAWTDINQCERNPPPIPPPHPAPSDRGQGNPLLPVVTIFSNLFPDRRVGVGCKMTVLGMLTELSQSKKLFIRSSSRAA